MLFLIVEELSKFFLFFGSLKDENGIIEGEVEFN
jgi:hypothetical protein